MVRRFHGMEEARVRFSLGPQRPDEYREGRGSIPSGSTLYATS